MLDHRALSVLEAHLPVRGVGAHAGEVDARGERLVECVAHLARPILVVAGGHQQAVADEAPGLAVGVDVGCVGDVKSLALEVADQLVVAAKRPASVEIGLWSERPGGVGTIEADLHGRNLVGRV